MLPTPIRMSQLIMLPHTLFRSCRLSLVSILCLSCLALCACRPAATQAQADPVELLPSRDQLRQQLRSLRQLIIIYPAASPCAPDYASLAERFSATSNYLEISIYSDRTLPTHLKRGQPLLLLGRSTHFPLLKQWENSLPFSLDSSSFTFQGNLWDHPEQSLFLSWYPHPETPEIPISVLTGNHEKTILATLQQLIRQQGVGYSTWDYQLLQGSRKRLIGNYQSNWQPDPAVRWEFELTLEPRLQSPVVHLYEHEVGDPDIGQSIIDSLNARKQRFTSWLEHSLTSEPISYHIYGHPETMGLDIGEMKTAIRVEGEIHRIVHPGFAGYDSGLEFAIWIEEAFGRPARQILQDGLRAWWTPSFPGPGLFSLGASLLRAEGNVPLDLMLNERAYLRESPLVRDCYAGLFTDFLIEHAGKDGYLLAYQDIENLPLTQELADSWSTYQDSLKRFHPTAGQRSAEPAYSRGMTLAHEGYQIYNGYGSRQAEKAVHHLADIGCNALAIVPYTGTGNPQSSAPLRWSQRAGSENDAAVTLAHFNASSAGMSTMLKPQVWVRGGWPGDVNMSTEAEWERWFDSYHRWIRHYAILAEIHQMDILCVGTEFRHATMKHPDRWRDLIRKLRHIFHGKLTYAANWGEETNNLSFAEALDFVGVNFYYPLSEQEAPTDEELTRKLSAHLATLDHLSAKWGKPYVLTEIGYRSVERPWQHPHAEAGDLAPNAQAQARCYEIVLATLKDHSACHGLYWWKWPSYDSYPLRNPRSFTPSGKEAEEILRQAYQAW